MKRNVQSWERWGSLIAGASLLYVAARRRGPSALARTAGLGLLARGLTGYCPVNASLGRGGAEETDSKHALSGSRGIHVCEGITIRRPREAVYQFWRKLDNLPRFMRHLERVEMYDGSQSHWVVAGPAGTRLEWDAEIINEVENERLGWRSKEDADVVSAGSVQFKRGRRPGETRLVVKLQYAPPAGRVGAWLASIMGQEPARQVREDLQRVKDYLETADDPYAQAVFPRP